MLFWSSAKGEPQEAAKQAFCYDLQLNQITNPMLPEKSINAVEVTIPDDMHG